jgi:hypothetical protein
MVEGREVVPVVPITHTPPIDAADAIEIPAALKAQLGLDAQRSWIVIAETNDFLWPGPDLRPILGRRRGRFDFGTLPPRFFAYLCGRILAAHHRRKLVRISRSD